MTLDQLVERFRIDAQDRVEPYFCSDDDVAAWLSDAEEEAAIRARLLIEDVNSVYCEISFAAGVATAALHAKVYEIAHQSFRKAGASCSSPLILITREMLDRIYPDWRDLPAGEPRWIIQSETGIRLVPTPSIAGTVRIEAYRLPLKRLTAPTQKPEIHEANHIHLVQWALYKALSIPDSDFTDLDRARAALDAFERHFGLRPDADLRRATRSDEVQANVSYFP